LPAVAVWQPILLDGIWQRTGGGSWATTDKRAEGMREVERRAERYHLLPVKWPDPWPTSTLLAMRAATFAQQAGRAVAFSLAAFRQAFAGGKDLSEMDNVLVAAAACELHPKAVLKGIELQSTKDRLRAATEEAYQRGVCGVPSVVVGDEVFWGDDRLGDAAAALSGTATPG
jgi:2-hydroxychromene-2-carboxylate isomerase